MSDKCWYVASVYLPASIGAYIKLDGACHVDAHAANNKNNNRFFLIRFYILPYIAKKVKKIKNLTKRLDKHIDKYYFWDKENKNSAKGAINV